MNNEKEVVEDKLTADYITYKNHEGFPFKVINFDNPKYAPKEGIVELYPIKKAKGVAGPNGIPHRHKADLSFTVCTDKAQMFFVGIPNGFDRESGDLKFQKLRFNDVEILDLSVESQRRKFIVFKYSTFFVDSPNYALSQKTTYGLVDKAKEADLFFANRKIKRKAAEIAEALVGELLEETALALGIDPKMYSPTQLSKAVIEYAEDMNKVDGKTGAQRFLEAYDNDFKSELIILKRGLSMGIVTETPNAGIAYNGTTLGYSDDEVVRYLKNHAATAVSIDTQARARHGASTYSTPKAEPVKNEYEAEIANLKRQLQDAEAKTKKANEVAAEATSLNTIATESPELAELIETWGGKIKGLHRVSINKPMDERLAAVKKKVEEYTGSLKN